jgi:hypothetical protein
VNPELEAICNQIAWLERYCYERDCISQQPIPELSSEEFENAYRIAPQFINMLRDLLTDAIYFGIARLLDDAGQGQHQNLCMRRILATHPNQRALTTKLDKADTLFANGHCARNKLLAHADLNSVLEYPNSADSMSIDIRTLGEIIRELREIVQCFPENTLPPHPRRQNGWLGVAAILDNLGRSTQK